MLRTWLPLGAFDPAERADLKGAARDKNLKKVLEERDLPGLRGITEEALRKDIRKEVLKVWPRWNSSVSDYENVTWIYNQKNSSNKTEVEEEQKNRLILLP